MTSLGDRPFSETHQIWCDSLISISIAKPDNITSYAFPSQSKKYLPGMIVKYPIKLYVTRQQVTFRYFPLDKRKTTNKSPSLTFIRSPNLCLLWHGRPRQIYNGKIIRKIAFLGGFRVASFLPCERFPYRREWF